MGVKITRKIGHDESCPYTTGRHEWRPYFARTRQAVK